MTKPEQFLFLVQTTILTNSINLATSTTPERTTNQHIFSATGVLGMMDEALRASDLIPKNMTAYEAACDFCYYIIENLRKAEEKDGNPTIYPAWFDRP